MSEFEMRIFSSIYLSSILNLIFNPFVSFSLLIRKTLIMFKIAIKNKVNCAVASLINGEIVAPIFPTILTQPKLTEVISEG